MSIELSQKIHIVTTISQELEDFFHSKSYGLDLESIFIGVVCISPQFETFFKSRKPKFTRDRKVVESEGFKYEIKKCLEYDINVDFDTFKNSDESECRRLLANEILKSLRVLDKMKVKIKDFDAEKFKIDLENYFKENELK